MLLSGDINVSSGYDSITVNETAEPIQDLKRQGGMVLATISFLIGVIGNGLAVSILLVEKYRKVRPQTSITQPRTPSPVLRRSPNSSRRSSASSRGRDEIKVPRRRRKDNLGPFRTLVLALVSVDLAGTLVTSPVTLHLYRTNESITEAGGMALCKYSAFVMMFLGLATMASLTTMAVERLICIHGTFFYHREVTAKRASIVIVIVILASAAICALPASGLFSVKEMHPNTWCFMDWHSLQIKDKVFNYFFAATGIILIATTLLCNIFSVVGLFKMRQRMSFAHRRSDRMGIEMQNIIQLVTMTAIYLVCWTPLMIRILVNQIYLEDNGGQDRMAVWFATINPILDPWVYILFRRRVYRLLLKVIQTLPCCTSEVDVTVNLTPPTPVVSLSPPEQEAENEVAVQPPSNSLLRPPCSLQPPEKIKA